MVPITEATPITFLDPGPLQDGNLQLVLLATRQANAALGYSPSYEFEMRHIKSGEPLGGASLRIGENDHLRLYAGHIGYGVLPEHRGHHYAARACRLLRPLALHHGIETLWITCDPDNWASRRTCELAGARFIEIVRVPPSDSLYALGHFWKCRYRLDAHDWLVLPKTRILPRSIG